MTFLLEDSTATTFPDPALYWNLVALDVNRLAHTLKGSRQGGPPLSARALGIVHLAMHDAWFGIVGPQPGFDTWLTRSGAADGIFTLPPAPAGADPRQALAAAAYSALYALYLLPTSVSNPSQEQRDAAKEILDFLQRHLASAQPTPNIADAGFQFGVKVARRIVALLEVRDGEPGVDASYPRGKRYTPSLARGKFREDPTNPIKVPPEYRDMNHDGILEASREYHGPYYGESAARFGAQQMHMIADPPQPLSTDDEYMQSYRAVYHLGGATGLNTTIRSPDQTVSGYFWAYDGAKLLGTPPRLYNQIVRGIIHVKRLPAADTVYEPRHTSESIRLLTLVNVAMADAGVFAWAEKYHYEYWRPLSGVREHDPRTGPLGIAGTSADIDGDPFWKVLGAPRTNTNGISFKPPFPAYPSGHATFGAAAFQMVRRFYAARDGVALDPRGVDDIAFSFVSDELDGFSRDLYQEYIKTLPISEQSGNVRTRVVRHFDSLWQAIRENGLSRVFLGVHWLFDAFGRRDGLAGDVAVEGAITLTPIDQVHYATTGSRIDANGQVVPDLPIGGVPLGLEIADDIFDSALSRTPVQQQPQSIQDRYRDDQSRVASPGKPRRIGAAVGTKAIGSIEELSDHLQSWSTAGKATDTNIR